MEVRMSTGPQASLQKRLLDMAEAARRRALELPVGERRDALLRKAEDVERSAALETLVTTAGARLSDLPESRDPRSPFHLP
jgi:hypothetical protein